VHLGQAIEHLFNRPCPFEQLLAAPFGVQPKRFLKCAVKVESLAKSAEYAVSAAGSRALGATGNVLAIDGLDFHQMTAFSDYLR